MLTRITTHHDDRAGMALCRVEFGGSHILVGYGQLGNKDVDITLELLHRRVAPALLAGGVPDVEWNLREMIKSSSRSLFSPLMLLVLKFELNYKMMGVQLCKAVAGVDSAIWDALTRQRKIQVWELWRQVWFDRRASSPSSVVRVYASSIARSITPEALASEFCELKQRHGITAFKMKVGERMGGVHFGNRTGVDQEEASVTAILHVQRAIGSECKLAVDCNGALTSEELSRWLLPVWFLEEPCPWFLYSSSPSGQRRASLSIAGGEQEFRADVWQRMMAQQEYDILQPDFGYAGGPSAVLLIARQCSSKGGVRCVPHSPQNDLHPIMALHMLKAMNTIEEEEEAAYLELACVDDGLIQVRLDADTGVHHPVFSTRGGLRVVNGQADLVPLPTQEDNYGWGVPVDASWLANATVTRESSTTTNSTDKSKRSHL